MSGVRWITSGSKFWVTKHLQNENQALSTNAIWKAVADANVQELIPSKTHLKKHVLIPMLRMGCIYRSRADDIPNTKYTKDGWKLNPQKAFKFIHPDLRGEVKF